MLWWEYLIETQIAAEFSIFFADQFLKSALYLICYLVQIVNKFRRLVLLKFCEYEYT
jgi:hypothetical protein